MIQDDNKIIFNTNQNFYHAKQKIKNDVTQKTISINGTTVYYACITDITYNTTDDEITVNLQARNNEEYEITIPAEKGDDEIYPSYLAINYTNIAAQAITTIILETMKAFTDDNTTLPEATEINELQSTISTLQGQITTKNEQIETLNGQISQLQETITGLQAQIEALTPNETPTETPTTEPNTEPNTEPEQTQNP